MSVPDSSFSPSPEQIDAWRQNIRDTTRAHYCLCMGVAIQQQGEPRQALSFFQQGLAYAAYRDEMDVAMADALRASGDVTAAERVLTAAAARDPQAELKGRSGLCQIYAATPVIAPAVTLACFDQALDLARKQRNVDEETVLSVRRVAFGLRSRTMTASDPDVRQILTLDFDAFNRVDAVAGALSDFVREYGATSASVSPVTLFDAWCTLLRLVTRVAPGKRPNLAFLESQFAAAIWDLNVVAQVSHLVALAQPLADDREAQKFLFALGNYAFYHCNNFAVAADVFLWVLKHAPHAAAVKLQAACCLVPADRPGPALELLRSILEQSPTPDQAGEIAVMMVALGHLDEAATIAATAIQANAAGYMPRLAMGIVLQAKFADDEASAIVQSLRASHPQEIAMLILHATQLLVSGQANAALLSLNAAIRQDAAPSPALFWQGIILAYTGDAARGRDLVAQAIKRLGIAACRMQLRIHPRTLRILHEELDACGLVGGSGAASS